MPIMDTNTTYKVFFPIVYIKNTDIFHIVKVPQLALEDMYHIKVFINFRMLSWYLPYLHHLPLKLWTLWFHVHNEILR